MTSSWASSKDSWQLRQGWAAVAAIKAKKKIKKKKEPAGLEHMMQHT